MKQAALFVVNRRTSAAGSGATALDHPLPTGRVAYEMAVVVIRQERHFEPSVSRVLGADKEPEAESTNRESPKPRRCSRANGR
jgi:hypothetical protein